MKIIDTLSLSTRMFKARILRTFLTVLGMSVGIAAVLFLVSLGYGLQQTLLERITTSDSLLTLDIAEAKGGIVTLDSAILNGMRAIPEVQEVSSSARFLAQASFEDSLVDISAPATDQAFFRLGGIRMDKGDPLDDGKSDQLILSSALSKVFEDRTGKDIIGQSLRLKLFKAPEGEEVKAPEQIGDEHAYTVAGVFPSDENAVYVNQNSLGDIKIDRFAQAKVKVKAESDLSSVRDTILTQGFLVSSLSDTVDQANKIFSIVQLVLMSFGVIALIVSAIGMFNTMTIALLERTEEIGIMKSIGASDLDISLLFILEATLMGFLGGLAASFWVFSAARPSTFLSTSSRRDSADSRSISS